MDNLIEAIRTAVTAEASDDARAAGAQACRTILLALEAKAGEPLASAVAVAATTSTPPLAAMVGALRGVPPEQLLDLAIARLRAALPAGVEPLNVSPVRFQMIPMAPLAASVGNKAGS